MRNVVDGRAARQDAEVDVSVVIPARNAALTIGDQLVALAAQNFSGEFEVVVVDDGSTDDTRRIVESAPLAAIRLLGADPPGSGPGHARNAGAAAARGTLLAFCDADDLVDEGWLSAMVAALEVADLALGRLDFRKLNGQRVRDWNGGQEIWTPQPHRGYLLAGPAANMGARRSAFEGLGGFDPHLNRAGEDVDLCWRAQLGGLRVQIATDAVVHYRLRSSVRASTVQHFRYASADPLLYRRYRSTGMRRERGGKVVRDLAWLAKHAPDAIASTPRRAEWLRGAAVRAGRLAGSMRHRVFYP